MPASTPSTPSKPLLDTLEALLGQVVRPAATPRSTSLGETLQALDTFLLDHRAGLPHDLIHYLERRSYQKALAYLHSNGTLPHQR